MTTERHLTESELTATLAEVRRSPAAGSLVAIVVRPDKELRELPETGELTPEAGLVGDRWQRYVAITAALFYVIPRHEGSVGYVAIAEH